MTEPTSKYLYQTKNEEIANSITHGLGVVLSLVGLVIFIVVSPNGGLKTFSLIVFGVALTILFSMSLFSHALTHPKAKRFFQILDYATIYILIAGTYTPIILGPLNTQTGVILLIIIWALAIGGVLFKIFLIGKYELISMITYLSMGWMIVFFISDFVHKVPLEFLLWIGAGGISYTVGTIFYLSTKIRYHHFIWHIFVLIGSICHYLGILFYIALSH